MKTKTTSKFIMLILSVMMIAALFVGISVTASAATNSGLKPGDTFYFTPELRFIAQTQGVGVVFLDESGKTLYNTSSDTENDRYFYMTKYDGDIWSLVIPEGAYMISVITPYYENGSAIISYSVDTVLSEAPGIYLKYTLYDRYEWLTTTYTAPQTNEAKIYGANVNLGGDISMKYYVEIGSGLTIEQVKIKALFLGEERTIEVDRDSDENPVKKDNYYVFTLTDIPPQCMGDLIDAQLIHNGNALTCRDSNKLGYSVKQNLVNIYNDSDDEALKQLIIDTLEYGAAAQMYQNYKTDALVTAGDLADAIAADTDADIEETSYTYTGSTDAMYLAPEGVTVHFNHANSLVFKFALPENFGFTVDGATSVSQTVGEYRTVSLPIAPTDFCKDVVLVLGDGIVTVKYSINAYCWGIKNNEDSSDEMKDLAKALYNYGLSAHNYKGHEGGTATCSERAVCTICGNKYGEPLDHNYTYTEDQDTATITERCTAGCGHVASVKLEAPQNAVYDGNEHPATLTYTVGTAFKGATPTITYNTPDGNAPVDSMESKTYMATLQVGPHSVNVTYIIHRATPKVTALTANVLTYNGSEQALVTAGTANGGTLVYSLTHNGEFTTTIPTGKDAGDYTVYYYVQGDDNHNDTSLSVIHVEIKKAEPNYVMPTGIIVTYGKPLSEAENGLPPADSNGSWSWKDQTTVVTVDAGEQPSYTAVFTPTDTKNYETVDVEITVKVESLDMAANNERVEVTGLDAITYTGSEIELANLVIKDGEKTLVENKDYTIVYENNAYVGTATVKIVFMGNYMGTVEETFEIKKVTNSFDGEWIELMPTTN